MSIWQSRRSRNLAPSRSLWVRRLPRKTPASDPVRTAIRKASTVTAILKNKAVLEKALAPGSAYECLDESQWAAPVEAIKHHTSFRDADVADTVPLFDSGRTKRLHRGRKKLFASQAILVGADVADQDTGRSERKEGSGLNKRRGSHFMTARRHSPNRGSQNVKRYLTAYLTPATAAPRSSAGNVDAGVAWDPCMPSDSAVQCTGWWLYDG